MFDKFVYNIPIGVFPIPPVLIYKKKKQQKNWTNTMFP